MLLEMHSSWLMRCDTESRRSSDPKEAKLSGITKVQRKQGLSIKITYYHPFRVDADFLFPIVNYKE